MDSFFGARKMDWSDRFQELSPLNWAGVALFVTNVILFPFMLIESDQTYYDDGVYPPIELLFSTQLPVFANEHTNNTAEEKLQTSGKIKHDSNKHHAVKKSHLVVENNEETELESTNISVAESRKDDNPFARICYELGPLDSDEKQVRLQNLVEAKGMFANIRFDDVRENLGFWVYIPPLRSTALARLKVEELLLKGFKDVALLSKNQPANAISLGVFEDQKNANQLMLKAQSLGFNAKMDVRYESLDKMWLSVEVSRQRDLDEANWAILLEDFPNTQLRSVSCL